MRYDQKFNNMRDWLFYNGGGRPDRTPINVLNYFLNRYALDYLDMKPDHQVLEVGCDRGHFMSVLQRHCARVVGIDVNQAALGNNPHPEAQAMDAMAMTFADATFDRVVSMHTIEHVPDLKGAFAEMARVLKPGGKMVHIYPWEPIRGYSAAPGALLAYGNIRMARELHLHKLDPQQLVALGAAVGLKSGPSRLVFTPFPFFPSYISVLQKD